MLNLYQWIYFIFQERQSYDKLTNQMVIPVKLNNNLPTDCNKENM